MHNKYYCLKCERPNNCLCGTKAYQFPHSSKVRPPTSTKNKERFRQFLDKCCYFPNVVPDNLQPYFRNLLRKVKYFDKAINGLAWTKVNPNSKPEKTDLTQE